MSKEYKGMIIEESLEDNIVLNAFEIIGFKITKRWHLYTVQVSKEEIEKMPRLIKKRWYAHFWKDRNIIVVFKNKFLSLIMTTNPAGNRQWNTV